MNGSGATPGKLIAHTESHRSGSGLWLCVSSTATALYWASAQAGDTACTGLPYNATAILSFNLEHIFIIFPDVVFGGSENLNPTSS